MVTGIFKQFKKFLEMENKIKTYLLITVCCFLAINCQKSGAIHDDAPAKMNKS
jgi:hypothetical protein